MSWSTKGLSDDINFTISHDGISNRKILRVTWRPEWLYAQKSNANAKQFALHEVISISADGRKYQCVNCWWRRRFHHRFGLCHLGIAAGQVRWVPWSWFIHCAHIARSIGGSVHLGMLMAVVECWTQSSSGGFEWINLSINDNGRVGQQPF